MSKELKVIKEEPEENDKEYKDILDVIKDGTKVYDKSTYHLDENFVWCKKPDEKRANFITRQHIVAKKIEESFPKLRVHKKDKDGNYIMDSMGHKIYEEIDNPYAHKAYLLVMMPATDWAILNRNDIDNVIITGILKWGDSTKELVTPKEDKNEGKGGMKKITQYFKKIR